MSRSEFDFSAPRLAWVHVAIFESLTKASKIMGTPGFVPFQVTDAICKRYMPGVAPFRTRALMAKNGCFRILQTSEVLALQDWKPGYRPAGLDQPRMGPADILNLLCELYPDRASDLRDDNKPKHTPKSDKKFGAMMARNLGNLSRLRKHLGRPMKKVEVEAILNRHKGGKEGLAQRILDLKYLGVLIEMGTDQWEVVVPEDPEQARGSSPYMTRKQLLSLAKRAAEE